MDVEEKECGSVSEEVKEGRIVGVEGEGREEYRRLQVALTVLKKGGDVRLISLPLLAASAAASKSRNFQATPGRRYERPLYRGLAGTAVALWGSRLPGWRAAS